MAPRGSESGPSSSRRAARTRTDRSAAGRPPVERDPGRLLRLAASAVRVMVASMESGAYAASFLLEMPLYVFCALGLAGLVVLTRRVTVLRMRSLVLASWMVALSRPEGHAPATVLLGAALWMGRCDQPLQRIFAAFGTFVAGMAIYQVWHFRHFGDWAPNAYY